MEKRTAEDEMLRQHHQLEGRVLEQTPGNGAAVHGVAKSWTQLSN